MLWCGADRDDPYFLDLLAVKLLLSYSLFSRKPWYVHDLSELNEPRDLTRHDEKVHYVGAPRYGLDAGT